MTWYYTMIFSGSLEVEIYLNLDSDLDSIDSRRHRFWQDRMIEDWRFECTVCSMVEVEGKVTLCLQVGNVRSILTGRRLAGWPWMLHGPVHGHKLKFEIWVIWDVNWKFHLRVRVTVSNYLCQLCFASVQSPMQICMMSVWVFFRMAVKATVHISCAERTRHSTGNKWIELATCDWSSWHTSYSTVHVWIWYVIIDRQLKTWTQSFYPQSADQTLTWWQRVSPTSTCEAQDL